MTEETIPVVETPVAEEPVAPVTVEPVVIEPAPVEPVEPVEPVVIEPAPVTTVNTTVTEPVVPAAASDPTAIKYVDGHPVYVGGTIVADLKTVEQDAGKLISDTIAFIEQKV